MDRDYRDIPVTPWKRAESLEELPYHYNRQEREAQRLSPDAGPSGGFFRRNRALTLIILDVFIVVILFIIYLVFLRPMEGEYRVAGYRFRVETFVVDDDILVAVDLRAPRDATGQPVVVVRVDNREVRDLAPRAGEDRRVVIAVPREGFSRGTASLTVTIDGERQEVDLSPGDNPP